MSNQYLLKEYEVCFAQLRFYDERHENLLKYLFTLTSAVATAQFAVYKLLEGATFGFYACQAFLSIVVFIATLLLYLAMLQNRLYFVYTARQLNAIRGFLMFSEASEFKNNQLYTTTDFSAFKLSSVHTFQLIGAALISSLFAGVSSFAFCAAVCGVSAISAGIGVAVIIGIMEIAGGIKYLADSGKKTADEAVHGLEEKEPEQDNPADR